MPGPPIPILLVIFFRWFFLGGFFFFFFFLIRPIDPLSGKAFDAKRKKKGMALVYVRIRRENSRASLKATAKHCGRQDKIGWNA